MRLLDDFLQYKKGLYLYTALSMLLVFVMPMHVFAQEVLNETETVLSEKENDAESKEVGIGRQSVKSPVKNDRIKTNNTNAATKTREPSKQEALPVIEKPAEEEKALPVIEKPAEEEKALPVIEKSAEEEAVSPEETVPSIKTETELEAPLLDKQTKTQIPVVGATDQQRKDSFDSSKPTAVLAVADQSSSQDRIISPAESVGIPPSTSEVREYRDDFTRYGASEALAAQQSSSNGSAQQSSSNGSAVNYTNNSLSDEETRLGYLTSIGLLIVGVLMIIATQVASSSKVTPFPLHHRKSNHQTT